MPNERGQCQAVVDASAVIGLEGAGARRTAMLLTILIGATIFSSFVNFTTMQGELRDGITRLGLPPLVVIAAMMGVYVVLERIKAELTTELLTLPVFFPAVTQVGLDPVWFGLLSALVVQVGLNSEHRSLERLQQSASGV